MENEINNPTGEQNTLDNKFAACTSFSPEILQEIVSTDGYKKYRQKFKIEDFRKKLIPHKMGEFAEPLYNFMLIECKKNDKNQASIEKNKIITREHLEFQEEIVLSLIGLLSGGKLYFDKIYIPKKDSIEIKNPKLIKLLTESVFKSLKREIRRLGLNQYPLSREKAKEAINNKSDLNWIKEWMVSIGYLDTDYQSFTLDKFDAYCEKRNISDRFGAKKDLLENLIEEFAYDHSTEAPLDIPELNTILLKIRKEKSKRGPKETTSNLKYLAFTLSSLKRLNAYLKDPKIESMNEIAIENEDLRFVHDVMAFFNMIVDHSGSSKTTQSLEPFIRKMINTLNDQLTIEDAYLRLQILKYDCPNL